jgi:hypothetical protein
MAGTNEPVAMGGNTLERLWRPMMWNVPCRPAKENSTRNTPMKLGMTQHNRLHFY